MNTSILGRVSGGENLSMQEMADVIDQIIQGNWPENETALLLTGLRAKGETVEEIAGAAEAMRKNMVRIQTRHKRFIDTCGTGGDGSATFNISTAAALVTAAAGVPVAKHGNRKITSKTGSADVLTALGVNVEADVSTVERCLDELGIGFCFAPQLHLAMRNVADVRQKLGVPTVFNLLGPLSNPASAPFQLLGVGKPHLRPVLASALSLLGIQRAAVVCGEDGLDEVTLTGPTNVSHIRRDTDTANPQADIREFAWNPNDFGIAPAGLDCLRVDGPDASADMIRNVLGGQPGPARDIVILNAAAAIWIVEAEENERSCAQRAAEAIDSGAASRLLRSLSEASRT